MNNAEQHWAECERLYRREAILLQERRFDDWLALFTEKLSYRVPTSQVVSDGPDGPVVEGMPLSYYEDDRAMLTMRTNKVLSKRSWAEVPASRVRYFIQVLEVADGADTLKVRSNLLVVQTRERLQQLFSGERNDVLRRDGDSLRIAERVVMLDRIVVAHQALSIFF